MPSMPGSGTCVPPLEDDVVVVLDPLVDDPPEDELVELPVLCPQPL